MSIDRYLKALLLLAGLASAGCALMDDVTPRKQETNGLIATPPAYYSTAKARYLAAKYKDNLDRLVERITRNPKTASLQFANNISSVGGIGFFTHSATKTPDERYLEVVLATPETFEVKGEFSEKVQRLVSRYGIDLLEIVSGDNEIFQDREMNGYGLNLAWRNVVAQPAGNRVSLERAIIYFPKENVRKLLRQGLTPNELLADAVIFAVEDEGPLTLVSYRPQEPRSDIRAAIQEDNLAMAVKLPESTGLPAKNVGQFVKTPQSEQITVTPAGENPVTAAPARETKPVNLPGPVSLPTVPSDTEGPMESGETNRPTNVAKPAEVPLPDASLGSAAANTEPGRGKSVSPLAALKNESNRVVPESTAALRPTGKALEGYIVQLAFADKDKAQRWAESMANRGFAVSVTEAGGQGSLRVRLGNFSGRDAAERQLRQFKLDGLNGIVISLPQAFQPVARSSLP